ncbi:MAG: 4-hydroxy-tetrahydrodipicolinate synthase [Opitutales bacterium]
MTQNSQSSRLQGVFTALATPMHSGAVDFEDLGKLLEHQFAGGIDGLVPVGTTGESPTLKTSDEHLEVIRQTVKIADGRVPVIAGVGSNSTEEAVHMSLEAEKAGADALLHVTPYYNKPNQEGLFQHFSAIAQETELPIVLYSIPGRCVIEIDIDTVARLYEAHSNISAIKESGGNPDRVTALRQKLGSDYTILSGDDGLTLEFMQNGADGVISVASNIAVTQMAKLMKAIQTGDTAEAQRLDSALQPFFSSLFLDPNPVPVKHILAKAGIIKSPEVRLPLTPLQKQFVAKLESAYEAIQGL